VLRFITRSVLALVFGLAIAHRCVAQVTVLSGSLTVDDAFTAYISTSDTVAGTSVAVGTSWPQTITFSANLTPGVTNYLHVMATDGSPPNGFLGSFSLSGTGFYFADGTQSLNTAPSTFLMSTTAFGSNYVTPTSAGFNGVGPWGYFSGMSASAQWLSFPASSTVYFSAAISAVPEPGTAALLSFAIAGLLVAGGRKSWRRARTATASSATR
jgi:hypothetical protein